MADPMYRQIAEELRRQIESGNIAPGHQLPTELELRDRYTASRNTVRDAIKWLTTRGLVESKPGQGTFVSPLIEPILITLSEDPETGMAGGEGRAAFAEIIRQRERKRRAREEADQGDAIDQAAESAPREPEDAVPRASVPTIEVNFASDSVAELLRINAGDEVLLRHQKLYIGWTPWSLQTTFYPMKLVDRGASSLMRARDIEEGTVKYLSGAIGLVQCGYRVRMVVRPPDEAEARFFLLPEDGRVPVVTLIRTGYEATENHGPYPFRATLTVLPADRHQFVIDSGDVPRDDTPPIANEPWRPRGKRLAMRPAHRTLVMPNAIRSRPSRSVHSGTPGSVPAREETRPCPPCGSPRRWRRRHRT